jgi:hypothetical protein
MRDAAASQCRFNVNAALNDGTVIGFGKYGRWAASPKMQS